MNGNGKLLAAGSEHGTSIKIYATEDGSELRTFTRGKTYCSIRHLCFSKSSGLISLTSNDKQTIHVWRCGLESVANTAMNVSASRRSSIFERIFDKIKGNDSNEHMMW